MGATSHRSQFGDVRYRLVEILNFIENPKKLSVFWAQKFRTRREISVFAKLCKISKRSLKEAKSRRFGGCEFRELIYSNFSIHNSDDHIARDFRISPFRLLLYLKKLRFLRHKNLENFCVRENKKQRGNILASRYTIIPSFLFLFARFLEFVIS